MLSRSKVQSQPDFKFTRKTVGPPAIPLPRWPLLVSKTFIDDRVVHRQTLSFKKARRTAGAKHAPGVVALVEPESVPQVCLRKTFLKLISFLAEKFNVDPLRRRR